MDRYLARPYIRKKRLAWAFDVFKRQGSGKGRVLLIAAQTGSQRIIGVEFSGELCEIARKNVKTFLRQTQINPQIEVIESGVTTWP